MLPRRDWQVSIAAGAFVRSKRRTCHIDQQHLQHRRIGLAERQNRQADSDPCFDGLPQGRQLRFLAPAECLPYVRRFEPRQAIRA